MKTRKDVTNFKREDWEEYHKAQQSEASGVAKPRHALTPWNHRPKDLQSPVRYIVVEDNGFDRIIAHALPTEKDNAFANADLIVRAVNSHEELVQALKAFQKHYLTEVGHSTYTMDKFVQNLDSVIAKAEGK